MLLKISLFVIFINASCLPNIYLKAISRLIPESKQVEQEIKKKLNKITETVESISERVNIFFTLLIQNEADLRKPLESSCKGNEECLRLCGLLADALEVNFRMNQLPPNSFLEPLSVPFGILQHYQQLRILAWTPSKQTINIQRMFQTSLLYLKLRDAIEGSKYVRVLRLLEHKQVGFLSMFIQKSTNFYVNWISRESEFVFPSVLKGKIFKCPYPKLWYQKLTNLENPEVVTADNFGQLLLQQVNNPIQNYKTNPKTFDAKAQFQLVANLLYLNQHFFLFSVFLHPSSRVFILNIEYILSALYVELENLLKLTLQSLFESTFLLHILELNNPQTLMLNSGKYVFQKVEVYYVEFDRTRCVTLEMTKNSMIKIYISGIDREKITAGSMQKIIEMAIISDMSFTSETLSELVQFFLTS